MTRFFLNFNRTEALEYQFQMASELLQVHEASLQGLQKQADDTIKVREMVTGYPETWKPLVALMKPTAGQAEAEKYLLFQKKIVQFLKAKKKAIHMVMNDQKDPKVGNALRLKHIIYYLNIQIWASQHFHEMTLVDELMKIFPKRAKKVLKELFEKIQMAEPSDKTVFQVSMTTENYK